MESSSIKEQKKILENKIRKLRILLKKIANSLDKRILIQVIPIIKKIPDINQRTLAVIQIKNFTNTRTNNERVYRETQEFRTRIAKDTNTDIEKIKKHIDIIDKLIEEKEQEILIINVFFERLLDNKISHEEAIENVKRIKSKLSKPITTIKASEAKFNFENMLSAFKKNPELVGKTFPRKKDLGKQTKSRKYKKRSLKRKRSKRSTKYGRKYCPNRK